MRCSIATFALSSFASVVFAAPLPSYGGSAYTGPGGSAVGGTTSDTNNKGGLANGLSALGIASGTAGHGGKATSGTAFGGDGLTSGGNGGSAYSGVGGIANGGSVSTNNAAGTDHHGWGYSGALDDLEAADIASGNPGSGGDLSSGNTFGGHA